MKARDIVILGCFGFFLGMSCNSTIVSVTCAIIIGVAFYIEIQ